MRETRQESGEIDQDSLSPPSPDSGYVFGAFWLLLFLGSFLVAGPWAGFHGILFAAVGLLMCLRPPAVALPRIWWLLAAGFLIAAAASFLPVAWFGMPEWRLGLERLGVATGSRVVIQSRQAAESLALFAIMLFTGLWLAGHRPSSAQLRVWALAFTLGVATYAVLAKIMQHSTLARQSGADALFGFFPNRNHTATYLAMGSICGLGNVLQALRDKRFPAMIVALAATLVCLWAVAGWSLSRAGVVLVAIGCLIWLPLLGTRYLGAHGRRALALIALAVVGVFFLVDTGAKQRISKTVEQAGSVLQGEGGKTAGDSPEETMGQGKAPVDSAQQLDFRIPTALDTLDLIRAFPCTGIGAGQFYYVFPQYRQRTAVANDSDNYHPESDWLWMAAETGVPAALALAALVILAFGKSLRAILAGRDRALRSACLVAALIVPLHGVFDVPGHRITLAWSAAFLFALSLRPPGHHPSQPVRRPAAWLFLPGALGLLAAAVFLIRAQWWGGPPPALVLGDLASQQAFDLYREDQARQKAAAAAGQAYLPTPQDDLLEQALVTLEHAARLVPLHRRVRHLQGFIGLHFEDESLRNLVLQSFPLELALDPTWVGAPLNQALAWSNANPRESARLWDVALERARWMDQQHPGSAWSEVATRARIAQQVRGKPALEALWKERSGR